MGFFSSITRNFFKPKEMLANSFLGVGTREVVKAIAKPFTPAKIPDAPPPPADPGEDPAVKAAADARVEEERNRKGRASTILFGESYTQADTAKKVLLGS
jgi:hypothetical protein